MTGLSGVGRTSKNRLLPGAHLLIALSRPRSRGPDWTRTSRLYLRRVALFPDELRGQTGHECGAPLVVSTGFEPASSSVSWRRSTGLSYETLHRSRCWRERVKPPFLVITEEGVRQPDRI